jgi:TPR repeat protein/SpoVK/Ycf46/Vps4 family AAA+-type ATPase
MDQDLLAKAKSGDAAAQVAIGSLYRHGEGVDKDPLEAAEWFRRAAAAGSGEALQQMGELYYYGEGLAANKELAVDLFSKAAAAGSGPGCIYLGLCYETGSGVEKSASIADDWFKRGVTRCKDEAARGDARCAFLLGFCYEHRKGVNIDLYEAARWYQQALSLHSRDAKAALDELARQGIRPQGTPVAGAPAAKLTPVPIPPLPPLPPPMGRPDPPVTTRTAPPPTPAPLPPSLYALNALVGQDGVKAKIAAILDRVTLDKARSRYGLRGDRLNLHMAFVGPPGTGKTTVARMLGEIFREADVLPSGQLIETSASELLSGTQVGEGGRRMAEKIKQARGGVLFIDEAYNFTEYKGKNANYAMEALELLMRAMTDPMADVTVVIAGYEDEIQRFLLENRGLKSRIETFVEFASYSTDELARIYAKMVSDRDYSFALGCAEAVLQAVTQAPERNSRTFGNARFVKNFFDETLKVLGSRIAKKERPSKEDVTVILPDDIQRAFRALWQEPRKTAMKSGSGQVIDLPPVSAGDILPAASPKPALDELEALAGLDSIKAALKQTAREMQFYKDRMAAGLPVAHSARHFVFTGNPGTGKTTVARILGRILKEIGYLDQGHVIETSGYDLISPYVGENAQIVATRVADALGGILFIDEAYSLLGQEGQHGNASHDSITTLVKLMEDYRDKFVVIAAGYPNEMESFLGANPGLRSRFTDILKFENYGPAELEHIFRGIASEMKYVLSANADAALKNVMAEAPDTFGDNFSNGRFVRNLFEDVTKNLASRVECHARSDLTEGPARVALLTTIEAADIASAFDENRKSAGASTRSMGFIREKA